MVAEVANQSIAAQPAPEGNLEDRKAPLPSVDEICDSLANIGEQALQTNDFLSYSTVLDMMIGEPKRFTEDEAVQILSTLHHTLSASDTLVYNVAWDIPEILLRYLEEFHAGMVPLSQYRPFRIIMDLFSLLSEKGNPHELFVKSAELISVFANSDLLQQVDPDAEMGPRNENIKLCALFELMQFSMKRIETKFPSKFLLEAATALLSVTSAPNADILTVTTCLRRMYLLARDFSMGGESEWSEDELTRLRTILTSFLTYAVEAALLKYPLHWAERLYLQIVNKLQLASPEDRSSLYRESERTTRLTEAVDRISMLLLSYDFDAMDQCEQLCGAGFQRGYREDEARLSEQEREGPGADFSNSPLLKGPSVIGCVFLKTHSHFVGKRVKSCSLEHSITATRFLMEEPSAGVFDVILYWALWMSQYVNEHMLESTKTADVDWYLDTLLYLSSMAQSHTEKLVVCSVIMRVLRARKFDSSLNFSLAALKEHHFESEETSEAVARMLISLVKGKLSCRQNPVAVADMKHDKPRILSDAQKSQLLTAVSTIVDEEIAKSRLPQVPVLSLLALVNTDPSGVAAICDKVDNALGAHEGSKGVQNIRAATQTLRKAEVLTP